MDFLRQWLLVVASGVVIVMAGCYHEPPLRISENRIESAVVPPVTSTQPETPATPATQPAPPPVVAETPAAPAVDPTPPAPPAPPPPPAAPTLPALPYIVGADISSVQAAEARGTRFSDQGETRDILAILKDHGFNYVRLRVFNDPTKPTPRDRPYSAEGFCDLPHTIAMAQRVKAAGMGLMIDFHYSDSWADPQKQFTPAAWANLPFDELVTTLHDWTRDAIRQMNVAGAMPDIVQIGNEITPGMMTDHGGSTRDWDQLAQLLRAGISAVKEVDPRIYVMLHIDKGGDNAATRRWVDAALAHGVAFDILGESCYTRWQGEPETWKANFEDLVVRYPNLKFLVAELAFEVRAANEVMRALPPGKGLGTFVWEPTQNNNGQGLFSGGGGGSRGAGRGGGSAASVMAVNPAKMGVYDDLAKSQKP